MDALAPFARVVFENHRLDASNFGGSRTVEQDPLLGEEAGRHGERRRKEMCWWKRDRGRLIGERLGPQAGNRSKTDDTPHRGGRAPTGASGHESADHEHAEQGAGIRVANGIALRGCLLPAHDFLAPGQNDAVVAGLAAKVEDHVLDSNPFARRVFEREGEDTEVRAGEFFQLFAAHDEPGGGCAVLGKATVGADRARRMSVFDGGATGEPEGKKRQKSRPGSSSPHAGALARPAPSRAAVNRLLIDYFLWTVKGSF